MNIIKILMLFCFTQQKSKVHYIVFNSISLIGFVLINKYIKNKIRNYLVKYILFFVFICFFNFLIYKYTQSTLPAISALTNTSSTININNNLTSSASTNSLNSSISSVNNLVSNSSCSTSVSSLNSSISANNSMNSSISSVNNLAKNSSCSTSSTSSSINKRAILFPTSKECEDVMKRYLERISTENTQEKIEVNRRSFINSQINFLNNQNKNIDNKSSIMISNKNKVIPKIKKNNKKNSVLFLLYCCNICSLYNKFLFFSLLVYLIIVKIYNYLYS